jgi:hypothetical protein
MVGVLGHPGLAAAAAASIPQRLVERLATLATRFGVQTAPQLEDVVLLTMLIWASMPVEEGAALVQRLLPVTEPLVAVRFGVVVVAAEKEAPLGSLVRAGSHSMVDRVVRLLQAVRSPG